MRFVLDTNVVSALRVRGRNPAVEEWAESIPFLDQFITATSIAEIERGIVAKERKDAEQGQVLRHWFENHVLPAFADRVLPFDLAAARTLATFRVSKHVPLDDALIAAVAHTELMTIATRNTTHFAPIGVRVVNPWLLGFYRPKRQRARTPTPLTELCHQESHVVVTLRRTSSPVPRPIREPRIRFLLSLPAHGRRLVVVLDVEHRQGLAALGAADHLLDGAVISPEAKTERRICHQPPIAPLHEVHREPPASRALWLIRHTVGRSRNPDQKGRSLATSVRPLRAATIPGHRRELNRCRAAMR